jgi:hypothetical protein
MFVEAMPDWLDKNAGGVVPELPVMKDVTNSLGVAIGLIRE